MEKASEREGVGDAVREVAEIADLVGPVPSRDGLRTEHGV